MTDAPRDPIDRMFDQIAKFVAALAVGIIAGAITIGLVIFWVYMWLTK